MKIPNPFRLAPSPRLLAVAVIMMALLLLGLLTALRPEKTVLNKIESSSPEVTRIIIQAAAKVRMRASGRLQSPDRVFFDLLGANLLLNRNGTEAIPMGNDLVKRLRLARKEGGVTRLVLDLERPALVIASHMVNSDGFMIELRPETPAPLSSLAGIHPLKPLVTDRGVASPPRLKPHLSASKRSVTEAALHEIASPSSKEKSPASQAASTSVRVETPKLKLALDTPLVKHKSLPAVLQTHTAKRNYDVSQSLSRALGLRVRRVVLDAGHGGGDTGAISHSGLTEKDLVLDVTRRLGSLIEEQLKSEVIYTRSEDIRVPLEARPALAKEKEADLFISIHANWSASQLAGGSETYYLNFAGKGSALDVALRENAGSQKSMHELQNLIQKIALNETVDESRELAATVESSLYNSLSLNNPEEKSRGVKQAPFLVLIGSRVPSILVEIGFLSNPQEENLLKRSDHRQRIAYALYQGVAHYMSRLNHFDMAKTQTNELFPGLCPSGVHSDSDCGTNARIKFSAQQIRETMKKDSRSRPYF